MLIASWVFVTMFASCNAYPAMRSKLRAYFGFGGICCRIFGIVAQQSVRFCQVDDDDHKKTTLTRALTLNYRNLSR